ncbi:MAG: pyridoxamine 5'-phosphate oxidase family protein [Anaerolineae bacterium]|nr:pyridoxamine 5'-phosphate oxidase family protein [Anaerolineae bacterium]
MTDTRIPTRSRPDIPKDYGIPETEAGMIEWGWVEDELRNAHNYWLATVRADGRPHTVPSWGAWVGGRFYFGGGPNTRHSRNLEGNPHISIHLESGKEVVIVEGIAQKVENLDPAIMAQIEGDYVIKYGAGEGANFVVIPRVAFAWKEYPTTVTRFKWE